MPTYDYRCPNCGKLHTVIVRIEERGGQKCEACGTLLEQVHFGFARPKFKGRILEGGGPDRFTADVLGIPLKDLPSGLKAHT